MYDLKIAVDQLKNYLGTGLKIRHCGEIHVLYGLFKDEVYVSHKTKRGNFLPTSGPLETMHPICYRLSDLDKEIEHNGERFVPEKELKKITRFSPGDKAGLIQFNGLVTSFLIMKKLFEWHFWPFGDEYFEHGLVIDKMRIPKK